MTIIPRPIQAGIALFLGGFAAIIWAYLVLPDNTVPKRPDMGTISDDEVRTILEGRPARSYCIAYDLQRKAQRIWPARVDRDGNYSCYMEDAP